MTLLAQEREQYVAVSNDKVQQAGLELKRFNEEVGNHREFFLRSNSTLKYLSPECQHSNLIF